MGERIVRQIGKGVLDQARVVPQVGPEQARVTVSGQASKILPFLPIPRVSETVEGPVERFVRGHGAMRVSTDRRRWRSLLDHRDGATSGGRWPSRSSY